jgi:hypothetical protein
MGWVTDPYYEKGKAEGFAKGMAEGMAEGLAKVLERRFGAIPAALRQRIFDADVETLDLWVERAFEAPDLQAVFEAN